MCEHEDLSPPSSSLFTSKPPFIPQTSPRYLDFQMTNEKLILFQYFISFLNLVKVSSPASHKSRYLIAAPFLTIVNTSSFTDK